MMSPDLSITRLNSTIFLFLQYFYTLLILSIDFDKYTYIKIFIVTGILIFSLFYNKVDKIIGFFLVFCSIIVALIGKDPNSTLNYLLVVSPIISTLTTLDNKNLIYTIILPVLSYLFLLIIYNQSSNDVYSENVSFSLIGYLFITFVCIISKEKNLFRKYLAEIDVEINSFYTNKLTLKHPYKIYFPIKKIINDQLNGFVLSKIFHTKTQVKQIYCYVINNQSLVLINGTRFKWENSITNSNLILDVREKVILYNYCLSKTDKEKNVILYSKANNAEYVYIFKLSNSLNIFYEKLNLFSIYQPSFNKISDLLDYEKSLFSIKKEEINSLSDKRKYVSYAIKSMHFIRNRLTPFDNLTELIRLYFTESSSVNKNKVLELIKNESANSKGELKQLVARANYILESSKNPFNFNELDDISLINLYTALNRNLSYYFNDIVVETNINDSDEYKKLYVKLSKEGLEIFISDWLNNCKKYFNKFMKCSLELDENYVKLDFYNDYTLKETELNSLIKDINSTDRKEILKRSTNGISLIKEYLDDMSIQYMAEKMELENIGNTLLFSLSIKLHYHEDRNI